MTYYFEMWIIVEDHLSDMWLWGGFKYIRSWNLQMICGSADPDFTTDFHELSQMCCICDFDIKPLFIYLVILYLVSVSLVHKFMCHIDQL